MDYLEFSTQREAKAEIATMKGWDAEAQHLTLYNGDADGDHKRLVWVIAAREIGTRGDWRYMRADGFVR
jgi:hypothetical protein